MRHNPKALIFYIANTTYKTEARKERAALRLDDRLFFLQVSSNKNVSSVSCVKWKKYVGYIF